MFLRPDGFRTTIYDAGPPREGHVVPQSVAVVVLSLADTAWRAAIFLAYAILLIFVLYIGFIRARVVYGDDDEEESKLNCPSCGARTPANAETCDYCNEPIEG